MKRLIIALILFSTACLMSIGGYFTLKGTCENLDGLLTDALACAEQQEQENLVTSNDQLSSAWERSRTLVSVMTQHSHLDEFEQKIKMLDHYAQDGDFEQYVEAAYEAKNELHHLLESEKVTLGNIF